VKEKEKEKEKEREREDRDEDRDANSFDSLVQHNKASSKLEIRENQTCQEYHLFLYLFGPNHVEHLKLFLFYF